MLVFATVLPTSYCTSYRVRVICNYIVRLEISAAEIMNTFQKEQHLGLKTFESAESAESASPFQTSPDSKRVYI